MFADIQLIAEHVQFIARFVCQLSEKRQICELTTQVDNCSITFCLFMLGVQTIVHVSSFNSDTKTELVDQLIFIAECIDIFVFQPGIAVKPRPLSY